MSEAELTWPRLHVAPLRYDGSRKFRYPVDGLELGERRWVVHGVFGPEIGPHSGRLGFFPGDHTIEFYLPDRWWNVYAVFGPAAERRGYYCNVSTPAQRDGDEIVYTDLDIDLLVRADGSHLIMDEDEYHERAERMGYTAEVRQQVATAVEELVGAASQRLDLFDGVEALAFLDRVLAAARRA